MARITVTHFTDPWSVWCWAIQPQLRRLETRHGDRIRLVTKVGAIHETPVGPDFPRAAIGRMFGAARRASGMPLDPDVISSWPGTTHRAGIAAKAAELAAPDKAVAFLRRLREAALLEGRDAEDLKEQEDIAREVGIDPRRLLEALETDEATRDFYSDQTEARTKGVTGFPTVTFRNEAGLEVGVGGFQPTEAYEAALERVAGARLVEDPEPELLDFVKKYGEVTTAEVAETYDTLEDIATVRLLDLEHDGLIKRRERAGGYFWSPA